MKCSFLPNNGKYLSRVVSSLFRGFALSLLLAAFGFTQLHAQTVAYVVNNTGNSVSVIDTSTNTVTATIPVGNSPLGLAISPDGTRAYVTNQGDADISVIDTAANAVIATIPINNSVSLELLAITPDGKNLYVADFNNGLFVVSTASNSVIATIPAAAGVGVVITPDGTRAYVQTARFSSTGMPVIDTATNTVIATIPVPGSLAYGIADTPNGLNVYAVGGAAGGISVIATSSNTVAATIPVSFAPLDIAITPDGSRAYVTSFFTNTVNIIDTGTNTVEPATIGIGRSPGFLAVTPDGAFVYATNVADDTVSVIDTSTNAVVATVPVGTMPVSIAFVNLSTPFSQFSIRGLTVTKKGFTESATFTLGGNSSGLDLAHQPVTLAVDGFSLTIPPGSFKQVGGNMHFVFSGTINGLPVSMALRASGGTSTSFMYSITVNGVDLTGQPNPATVTVGIGENTGTATVPF